MRQLHIVLIPVVAQSHTIPDSSNTHGRLFTSRAIKTTIIATPAFAAPIRKAQESGHDIALVLTDFPPKGSYLPTHIVSLDQMTTSNLVTDFLRALELLQGPVEAQDLRPDCVISDMFLPWTAASAAKFGILRVVFYGTSCFARCGSAQLHRLKPYRHVSSDEDSVVVPDLPHQIKFVRTQVPDYLQEDHWD